MRLIDQCLQFFQVEGAAAGRLEASVA